MKDAIKIILCLALIVAVPAAYIQHFISTIQAEQWVVLVIGAIMPPLGVLHGILVWLGVF